MAMWAEAASSGIAEGVDRGAVWTDSKVKALIAVWVEKTFKRSLMEL